MAKHEIMIHENTSATKESAPYLGSYISKETLKTDEFAAKIAEKCGLPAIQVQAIIAGAFDAIEELEKEELVRLHVDGLTVCGIITGSFPTADAKFDPERNALQLALRLDEGVRNALADVTPSIITDASLTRLRIDNLADLEVQRPQNLVHGQHVFRVAGFCMVLSDEGAEAYFENAMGTRFELVIDEVISKQLFTAHTAALLEGGDYKLVVKSRAGDAAGPLQTATKRVKYLEVIDPPVPITETPDGQVKIMTAKDGGQSATFTLGHEWKIGGINMFDGAHRPEGIDWVLSEVGIQLGEDEFHILDATYAADGTLITVDSSGSSTTPEPGTYDDAKICIMAQKTGELNPIGLEIPIKLVVEG